MLPFLDELFTGAAAGRIGARHLRLAGRVARELELTAEEVGYLARAPPESAAVARILEESGAAEAEPEPPTSVPPGAPEEGTNDPHRPVQRRLSEFGR